MKQAIITGAETFGDYIMNPSKWLALSANGKTIAGYNINSMVFSCTVCVPTSCDNPGQLIVQKATEIDADVVISFGIKSSAQGIKLERSGTNWVNNEKYLLPSENNKPLEPSLPAKQQIQSDLSYWDIDKMHRLLAESNIKFESDISDSAGLYVCNGWIYRTLLAMDEKQLKIPYLFVHLPCTEESIELIPDFDRTNKTLIKKEDTLKVLEIILSSLK